MGVLVRDLFGCIHCIYFLVVPSGCFSLINLVALWFGFCFMSIWDCLSVASLLIEVNARRKNALVCAGYLRGGFSFFCGVLFTFRLGFLYFKVGRSFSVLVS